MQLTRRQVLAMTTAPLALRRAASPQHVSSERIVSPVYRFSVTRPAGWYTLMRGGLPSFYNFRAEQAGPQGEFPMGGASIDVLAQDGVDSTVSLKSWLDQEIAKQHGINVDMQTLEVTHRVRKARAIQVSFLQPRLGHLGPEYRFIIIAWQHGSRAFAAVLRYEDGDANAGEHKRALNSVVRSFEPM